MDSSSLYALAADALLVTHALFVLFVVLGLALVYLGRALSWNWVRNPCFRIVHLSATGVVVIQTWLGVICPLTIWEMELRSRAGQAAYEGSFMTHWLSELLYYHAPTWVFVLCYTVFGGMAVSSWFLVRPRASS